MVNFSADSKLYKKDFFVPLVFCCVTLVMLITRYAAFYTYKGSDDLHYAFLSSRVLTGSYDMFFAQDIYAGRAVVVLYQALWFKIFGINGFAMCMPSLSLLIVLAYLVCFKSGLQKNWSTILLGSALIYFNPVVTLATLGNLPDVYIAVIAVLVFLLIKKNTENPFPARNIFFGIIAALLLIAGLFVKESIVLMYAGTVVLLVYYRKKISRNFVIAMSATAFIGAAGYLLFYYINTGNLFYHFVQIKNAAYFNVCSYQCLPGTTLLKRLTVTVPLVAVITGAYPLLLLTTLLFTGKKQINTNAPFWKITFISLLLLALYFPFSIFPYVPLCHDMRQFFFLFPFAAILYTGCLQTVVPNEKPIKKINITGSIIFVAVTLICLFLTPYNKWTICCNAMLALGFTISVFSDKKVQRLFFYLIIPVILWLSTAYTIFKKPHEGYRDLKTLHSSLQQQKTFACNNFYFLNNDTKTHFALINKFDTVKQFINLDTVQNGFKPFIAYQQQHAAGSYQNGWLIVSEDYTENRTAEEIESIKQLLAQMHGYSKINKTAAYWLTSADTINKILNIVNAKAFSSGCY